MSDAAETPFYVFDGSNLFHAGGYRSREELVDALATFVALEGARGVVVFDGVGDDRSVGGLEIRYAPDADPVIERTVAERRDREAVVVVTSDATIRMVSGVSVRAVASPTFIRGLQGTSHSETASMRLGDRIDAATRERLERLRRGR